LLLFFLMSLLCLMHHMSHCGYNCTFRHTHKMATVQRWASPSSATVQRWASPSPNLYTGDDLSKAAERSKTSGFISSWEACSDKRAFFSLTEKITWINCQNILRSVHLYSCFDCFWIAVHICGQFECDFVPLLRLLMAVTNFVYAILLV